MEDIIAETLGVEPKELSTLNNKNNQLVEQNEQFTQSLIENKKDDYKFVRENLTNLIKETEYVVSEAINSAKSVPVPAMLEVLSGLIRSYASLNKDLMSLTNSVSFPKNTEDSLPQEQVRTTNNNVIFIGTSDSLINQIKANYHENGK